MIEVVKALSVKEKCEIMCHIERKVKSISGANQELLDLNM